MHVFFRRLSLHQQRLISMMKWGIFMNPARSGHQSEHTHTRVSFYLCYLNQERWHMKEEKLLD